MVVVCFSCETCFQCMSNIRKVMGSPGWSNPSTSKGWAKAPLGLHKPSVEGWTAAADVVPAVRTCNRIPGNTKGQTQGSWILSSVPTWECRQQRAGHSSWGRSWLDPGMGRGTRKGASDMRGSGNRCKPPEGVFLVSVDHVCSTQTRVQKPSRYPVLLDKEVFHFEYLKQTLRNVYIHHFQGNLLNGLYIFWAFKAKFMSSI